MVRKIILEQAIGLTTGDREEAHGDPSDTFGFIAKLWNAYLDEPVTPEDVCHMMTLLKIARMRYGADNPDDYIDACGYEALAGELAGING